MQGKHNERRAVRGFLERAQFEAVECGDCFPVSWFRIHLTTISRLTEPGEKASTKRVRETIRMPQKITLGYKELMKAAEAETEQVTAEEAMAGLDDVVIVDIRDIR